MFDSISMLRTNKFNSVRINLIWQNINKIFIILKLGAYYETSRRSGQHLLVFNGIKYFRNRKRGNKQYWKCKF